MSYLLGLLSDFYLFAILLREKDLFLLLGSVVSYLNERPGISGRLFTIKQRYLEKLEIVNLTERESRLLVPELLNSLVYVVKAKRPTYEIPALSVCYYVGIRDSCSSLKTDIILLELEITVLKTAEILIPIMIK